MSTSSRVCKVLPWLAALVVVLWAFGPTGARAAKNEITVGYSVSLTGRFATEASDVHKAYQLWAEDINKQGGIQLKGMPKKLPVKLIHYDDGSDTNNAVKNYQRLITRDNVDLLLSPWGSGINFTVSAVTEKYKYPLILSSAAADNIFGRGFKYSFETTQLASHLLTAMVDFLASKKGQVKTLAIAHENFLFTQSLHDTLKPLFEKAGLSIVADEQYPLGGQDFTSLLTKIKGTKPDAFLDLNIMPSSIYMTRQMNEIGLKPKVYAVNIGPMFTEEFIGKLGKITEGVMDTGFWHPDLPFPGARKFFDEFSERYGKKPSTDAAYAYMSTQILTQAIQQAGTVDREKVKDALHSGSFTTIGGPYQYDARGVNEHQLSFLCQVQNGKRVIVWPKEVATAEPVFPLPQ